MTLRIPLIKRHKQHDSRRIKVYFQYIIVIFLFAGMAIIHTHPMIFSLFDRTPITLNSIPSTYAAAEQSLLFFIEHPLEFYKSFSPAVMRPLPSPLFLCGSGFGTFLFFAPFYIPTHNLYFATNMLILIFLTGSAFSFFLPSISMLIDIWMLNLFVFPLIFLFFFKFIDESKGRDIIITGVLLALQFYMGFYHFIFSFYLLIIISIIKIKHFFLIKNIKNLISAGFISILIALPMALPYIDTMLDYRIDQMLNSAEKINLAMPFSPAEWLNVSPNNLLYGKWFAQTYNTESFSVLFALFPGITFWFLFLTGTFKGRFKNFSPWFLLAIVLSVILISTAWSPIHFFKIENGHPLFFALLLSILPFFNIIRVLPRLVLVFNFAGALLIGGGYLFFEQKLFNRHYKTALVVIFTFLINLENLATPKPLYNYDHIFGPDESTIWLKKSQLLSNPDELLLHIPSYELTFQNNIPKLKSFEEAFAPLFRHLHLRHPVHNGRFSYVPDGFLPEASKRLPEKIAQKYLSALGVKIVVVNGELLYGEYKTKFSRENMVKYGFKHLISFDNDDHIYLMEPTIELEKNLLVVPKIGADGIEISVATSEYYNYAYEKHLNFDIEKSNVFWTNPKHCKFQKMTITIKDNKGKYHSRTISYNLPIVIGGIELTPVKWDLNPENIDGPYELISIECEEKYFKKPLKSSNDWRLTYR